ncbi:MAG: hypothetical protein OHK0053_13130 [Microscillaceae bacterium]
MRIYESPYLLIDYNEGLQALTETWLLDFTTPVEGDNFRQPLQLLLDAFSKYGVKKWLNDASEQKTLASSDQIWLEQVFYPQLLAQGMKAACLVNTKNILGTVHAKNWLQNQQDADLLIEVFNHRELALAWIQSVPV